LHLIEIPLSSLEVAFGCGVDSLGSFCVI
jgi:hypothetical protein